MTTVWYSISFGSDASPAYVAEATSDPTADLAVELLLTNVSSSRQVLEALEAITHYIQSKGLESGAFANMPNP
jgi:hypothetical protein